MPYLRSPREGYKAIEALLEDVVGKSGANLILHGDTAHPYAATAEIATLLPFLRGPKGLAVAIKTGLEAKDIAAGARAGRQAYKTSTPIFTVTKKVKSKIRPTRTFKVNELLIDIPAGGSRLARGVERARDVTRPESSVLRAAGTEYGRLARTRAQVLQKGSSVLARSLKKMNDEEHYALRILADGITPEKRVAFFQAQAAKADNPAEVAFLQMHARLSEKSARLVSVTPEGMAPVGGNLSEAWRLLSEVTAPRREKFYREYGLLVDQQIKDRLSAPAKVMHGAEWKAYEDTFRDELASNAERAAIRQAFLDQGLEPEIVDAHMKMLDARVRHSLEAQGIPTADMEEEMTRMYGGYRVNRYPEQAYLSPSQVEQQIPGSEKPLFRAEGGAAPPEFERIALLTEKNRGGTWRISPEGIVSDAPKKGYVVATDPKWNRQIPEDELDGTDIFDYWKAHRGVLADDDRFLGTWPDPETGIVDLDVVEIHDSLESAIKVGRARGEKAIHDLERGEVIPITPLEEEVAEETISPSRAFQDAAAEELRDANGMARDVARALPEDEWPVWVRNNIRKQRERGEFSPEVEGLIGRLSDEFGSFRDIPNEVEHQVGDRVNMRNAGGVVIARYPAGARRTRGYTDYIGEQDPPSPEVTYDVRWDEKMDPRGDLSSPGNIGHMIEESRLHPEGSPLIEQQRIAPRGTDMSTFEGAIPEDARILSSEEAAAIGRSREGYVYHGTDPVSAEKILTERSIRAGYGDSAVGEGKSWVTADPWLAARYADAKTVDRGLGGRGAVIEIPRSAVPVSHRAFIPGKEAPNYARSETLSGPEDILFDRFSDRITSSLLGAAEFGPSGQFVMHLAGKAGSTTIEHEVAHLARRLMTPAEEKKVARFMGARKTKQGYEWTRASEEKFVETVLQVIRQGRGPLQVKQQVRRLSEEMRKDFYHRDLPDMPPHVADALERLWAFSELKGGRFVTPDGWVADSNFFPVYLGYRRGVPVGPHKTALGRRVGAYIRTANSLFSGGRKAIGGGPQDKKLIKTFKGELLASGMFENTADTAVEDIMLASRVVAARRAHEDMLQASTELPSSPFDQPIKVDPKKDTPGALSRYFDLMQALDNDLTFDAKTLEGMGLEESFALTAELFPGQIGGKTAREVAEDITASQKAIPNIRWVPADFIERTGLLNIPQANQLLPRGPGRVAGQTLGVGFDAVNDLGRAMLTYFNPAYVPMNLSGNIVMNMLHQGWSTPTNLWKSVQMKWSMKPEDRTLIDTIMGHGMAASETIGFQLESIQGSMKKVGHAVSILVDMIPRRAAFLHEARLRGHDIDSIKALLNRTDEDAIKELDAIRRQAVEKIVDFERLAPLEKKLTRFILFYPWMRGATRYTMRFAIDRPTTFAALVVLRDYAEAAAQEDLGDRPAYAAQTYPLGTNLIGAGLPFSDKGIGLDDLVGKNTWRDPQGNPMVFSIRQLFPHTTPIDIVRQIDDILQGKTSAVENLAPLLQAGITTATGKDTFYNQDVDRNFGTFMDQLIGQAPLPKQLGVPRIGRDSTWRKGTLFADTTKPTSVYPRTLRDEITRFGYGSVAPTPYRVSAGQRAAALDRGDTEVAEVIDLKRRAKAAKTRNPNKAELTDLKWKLRLDSETSGKDVMERAKIALSIFAERFPQHANSVQGIKITNEDQAETIVREVRKRLYAQYAAYRRALADVEKGS